MHRHLSPGSQRVEEVLNKNETTIPGVRSTGTITKFMSEYWRMWVHITGLELSNSVHGRAILSHIPVQRKGAFSLQSMRKPAAESDAFPKKL